MKSVLVHERNTETKKKDNNTVCKNETLKRGRKLNVIIVETEIWFP